MAEINRITVVIDGEVFELSSVESPEHIQKVAGYIDKKIKEIYSVKSEGSINTRLRTLFISLNIADDLFKEKQKSESLMENILALEGVIDNHKYEVSLVKEENSALKARINDLQKEITDMENRLNEYIEIFEINEGIKSNKIKRFN